MWQVIRQLQGELAVETPGGAASAGTLLKGVLSGRGERASAAAASSVASAAATAPKPNDAASRFHSNQHVFYSHERKAYQPPQDPMVLSRPFAGTEFLKAAQNLQPHIPTHLRIQALHFVIQLYHERREYIARSIREGFMSTLLNEGLKDPSHDVRLAACDALAMVVKEREGQEALLGMGLKGLRLIMEAMKYTGWYNRGEKETLQSLSTAAEEPAAPDDAVQGQEHASEAVAAVLHLLSSCHVAFNQYHTTTLLVNKLKCVELYVSLLREECGSAANEGSGSNLTGSQRDARVCAAACSALIPTFAVKESFIIFLECDGVHAVTEVLKCAGVQPTSPEVAPTSETCPTISDDTDDIAMLSLAADVVFHVALYPAGRSAAVKHQTLLALAPLMSHHHWAVRRSVAGAVAQLAVSEECKRVVCNADHIVSQLASRIQHEDERDALSLWVLALTSLAEVPQLRDAIREREVTSRLEEIAVAATEDDPHMSKTARNALLMLSRTCFKRP